MNNLGIKIDEYRFCIYLYFNIRFLHTTEQIFNDFVQWEKNQLVAEGAD